MEGTYKISISTAVHVTVDAGDVGMALGKAMNRIEAEQEYTVSILKPDEVLSNKLVRAGSLREAVSKLFHDEMEREKFVKEWRALFNHVAKQEKQQTDVTVRRARFQSDTGNDPLAQFRYLHGFDESVKTRIKQAEDGSLVIYRLVNGRYRQPCLRFYTDGRIEHGILWGGDVWEGDEIDPMEYRESVLAQTSQ